MRRIAFTPAAERALTLAAAWSASGDDAPIDLPALAMAILSEPECRAAEILARLGIDQPAVRCRWPQLAERGGNQHLARGNYAAPLRNALAAVRERLSDSAEREIATEHLLWGMALGEHEMAGWLAARGIDCAALERECGGEVAGALEWDEVGEGSTEHGVRSLEGGVRSQEPGAGRGEPEVGGAGADVDATLVWRALDAAGNRAREGLRVVEDYVRFVLDDRHLTEGVKSLRHELSAALETLPRAGRLAARDTLADVGVAVSTPQEVARADAWSVASASLKRTGEALRSLEEFGKLLDASFAARIEALRYRLYTLEKAVCLTADSLSRLAEARLYVLIDGRESLPGFERLAHELIGARVDILQLRDKRLGDRELLERALALRALTRGARTLFVMNDRPDLARLADADGVHVGQEELTVRQVRRIVGPEMLIGVSTHSLAQAEQAVLDGASYIGVGPTFPSATKRFDQFPGLDLVRAVAETIRLPAFAIGGVTLDNVDQVLNAGLGRIAVSGAISAAENLGEAARALRGRLERACDQHQ